MGTRNELKPGDKLYYCANGKTYGAPAKCCLFCTHCDSVIYDFTNGPYMTHCTLDLDEDAGWEGTCDSFKEEVLDKEYINDEACEFTDEQIDTFWDTVKEAHEKEVENLEPFLTSPPKPGTPIGKE
jgi:hypothetical protein